MEVRQIRSGFHNVQKHAGLWDVASVAAFVLPPHAERSKILSEMHKRAFLTFVDFEVQGSEIATCGEGVEARELYGAVFHGGKRGAEIRGKNGFESDVADLNGVQASEKVHEGFF